MSHGAGQDLSRSRSLSPDGMPPRRLSYFAEIVPIWFNDPDRSETAGEGSALHFSGDGKADLRGLPPLAPLARAAEVLAGDVEPPRSEAGENSTMRPQATSAARTPESREPASTHDFSEAERT